MSEQVRLNHSADDVYQMRKDWAESFHFDAPADLPGLLDDYDALQSRLDAAEAEIAELDTLRNRQSDLLSQTAIALRGPEPDLTRYSHADIPSRVKMVMQQLAERDAVLRDWYPGCGLTARQTQALRERTDALLSSAEPLKCDTCHGEGEVWTGENQYFGYMSMQPPEPIMEVCPECGGEEAPSLPAAGSADLTAVRCQCCATEYPHDSYDAGFIAGSGMCQVCDAAIPAVDLPSAAPAEQPYPHGIAEDLERSDWTPLEALQWYAAGKHFDVADGRTRIIDTGAVASNALKHASLAYLELKGDAELSELRAVLSAQQSAQPEFCCKHSYKVAKQAAWGALDLTQCKCDHNEYCEHCWPDDFREGGKWHGGFETKQSAHVSMPTDAELVEMARKLGARPELCYAEDHHEIRWRIRPAVRALVRALLNGGEA